MEPKVSLTDYYDQLKNNVAVATPKPMNTIHTGPGGSPNSPSAMAWRNKALMHSHHLQDKCCKHLILDIYCKILPLDQEYIDTHPAQMSSDVDAMLSQKGMSPTQYLTSCYEATKAPLLEFLLRSTSNIARGYMEKADEEIKNSQENQTPIPPEPPTPEPEDPDVNSQIVDIQGDMEYNNFIEVLKKKTIDKIVADVSELIANKKEENNMTFDTDGSASGDPFASDNSMAMESAVATSLNYLSKHLWKESQNFDNEKKEAMIGLAIREATLHQFDKVFNLPDADFKKFESNIRYGKGILINESAINLFLSE